MRSLAGKNPNWAGATDLLRDLYDKQDTITLRLTPNSGLSVPSTPGGK